MEIKPRLYYDTRSTNHQDSVMCWCRHVLLVRSVNKTQATLLDHIIVLQKMYCNTFFYKMYLLVCYFVTLFMLNRGLGLEKAENMVFGFKTHKVHMCWDEWAMEGLLHPSLNTVCRVVLCCTGVVSPMLAVLVVNKMLRCYCTVIPTFASPLG